MNNLKVNEIIESMIENCPSSYKDDTPFDLDWEDVLNMLTVKTKYNDNGVCRVIANRRDRSYNILGLNVLRCWLANENKMKEAGYFMTYSKRSGLALYYKHN